MHIYGKDQQAFHLTRTRVEKYFSRINAIIVAMQLACWLCSIIRVAINGSNSMSNSLFSTSDLTLNAAYKVPGCVYNATRTHAFFSDVRYQLSPETVDYFVSRSVMNLRYIWSLTGVYTMVSIVNRLFFETNTHELRYHFAIFRKDTLTTWEVLLLVLGIVMTFGVNEENQILQDYLVYCSGADALPRQYYNSVLPFVELYVMYFISLGFLVINGLVAVWNLSKENPRDKLLAEEARKRAEWAELMRKYQHPGPWPDTSNSNTPLTGPSPSQPRRQQVTYGSNLAPVGGPTPEEIGGASMNGTSPPPALRRQQSPQTRTGPPPPPPPPPAAMYDDSGLNASNTPSLYANRLPSQSKARTGGKGTSPASPQLFPSGGASSRPITPPLEPVGIGNRNQRDPYHEGRQTPVNAGSGASGLPENDNGGRYELREVYDDEDNDPEADIVVDPTSPIFSSVDDVGATGPSVRQGTQFSLGSDHNYGGGEAGGRPTSAALPQAQPQQRPLPPPPMLSRKNDSFAASGVSTPLLATRSTVIPPPPPVALASDTNNNNNQNSSSSMDARVAGAGSHRPSVSKMLAPPSPLNNGNDTTTDTVQLQP